MKEANRIHIDLVLRSSKNRFISVFLTRIQIDDKTTSFTFLNLGTFLSIVSHSIQCFFQKSSCSNSVQQHTCFLCVFAKNVDFFIWRILRISFVCFYCGKSSSPALWRSPDATEKPSKWLASSFDLLLFFFLLRLFPAALAFPASPPPTTGTT